MVKGEKLQGTILFADIMGCSEISNNCPIEDYAKILDKYHQCGHNTREKLELHRYSDEVIEFSTQGDEVCLILHSKSESEPEKDAIKRDIRDALMFAIALKLRWRASKYNLKRVENGLLPRDVAIGIHQGPIYFYESSITYKKSSEGFAINLAKRIEGESRNGKHSQIMVSRIVRYWIEKRGIPVELKEHKASGLKGISTIPELHEIVVVKDELKNFIAEQIEDINFKIEDLEKYNELSEMYPSDFWTNLLVECLARVKRKESRRVERMKPEIKEIRKGTPSYYYNEAKKNYSIGKYEEAISNLNKAIELDPENAWAYITRGGVYSDLENYEEALADYTKATELDPENAWAYIRRGNVYRDIKKYEEALADYTKATELDPKYSLTYISRGHVYRDIKKYEEALADYTKATELDPENPWVYIGRGDVYSDLENYEEALADYTKAIELDPKYAWAYVSRGQVYRDLKKYDKALAEYNKAIELDPKYAWAYVSRGHVYRDLKKYEEALAEYDKAIEVDPKYAYAYYDKACLYALKEEEDKLIENLKMAIQLDLNLKEYAKKCDDLKAYRNKKWFKELTK